MDTMWIYTHLVLMFLWFYTYNTFACICQGQCNWWSPAEFTLHCLLQFHWHMMGPERVLEAHACPSSFPLVFSSTNSWTRRFMCSIRAQIQSTYWFLIPTSSLSVIVSIKQPTSLICDSHFLLALVFMHSFSSVVRLSPFHSQARL